MLLDVLFLDSLMIIFAVICALSIGVPIIPAIDCSHITRLGEQLFFDYFKIFYPEFFHYFEVN